jgi:hypothetical protein
LRKSWLPDGVSENRVAIPVSNLNFNHKDKD